MTELGDDADLVARAQRGDEEALRRLFERHTEFLRAFVRARLPALVQGKVAQSDVIQEAYLTAYAKLGSLIHVDPGGFRRWLTRIVEHKAKEEIRRHLGTQRRAAQREVRLSRSSGAVEVVARNESPSMALAAEERREQLCQALALLEDGDRVMLEMVHRQGLTYPEIGRLLCIQADAARMRHGRALARLGRKVEGMGQS